MDETKITAKLPHLDVEITRCDMPEDNAETISLRISVVPSFDAFAGVLLQSSNLPLLTGPWTSPWTDAWAPWMRLAQSVWAPWLEPMAPRLGQKPYDGKVE